MAKVARCLLELKLDGVQADGSIGGFGKHSAFWVCDDVLRTRDKLRARNQSIILQTVPCIHRWRDREFNPYRYVYIGACERPQL